MPEDVVWFEHSGYSSIKIPKQYFEIIKTWNTDRIKITISQNDDRSERSSRLFHSLCSALAKDQNVDKEYMKQSLKIAYGVTSIVMGYRIIKSTSVYTQEEMCTLIRGTIGECMDQGVNIQHLLPEWEELNETKNE